MSDQKNEDKKGSNPTDEQKAKDSKAKHYQNIKINKLPESQVEIEGEVSEEKMNNSWPKAVKKYADNAEISGFRKGKAPEDIIVKKVGEMPILEEAGQIALSEVYADILIDHKIDAIGQPRVQITKIAKGSPLGFKIVTSIVPEIELGDYKKATKEAVKKAEKDSIVEATDKDVEKVIDDIQNNRKQLEIQKAKQSAQGGSESNDSEKKEIKEDEIEVPEFDDEFVKTLGEFENVEDFKKKIKENIKKEKEREAKDKKRGAIIDALIETSKIDVPEVLINGELQKMLAQFKDDISKAGMTFEDYLKQIKKEEKDLMEEWRPSAVKRVKVQLILSKIANKENIIPTEEDVKKEVDQIMSQYKEADRHQATIYVESVLTNEMVLRKLEGNDKKVDKTDDPEKEEK